MANLSNINNKFLVTTGGNVGIGTTSPIQKLDTPNIIIGGSTIAGGIYRANSTMIDNLGGIARFYSIGPNTTTGGSYQFNSLSSNATAGAGTVMTIFNTGNVGIATAININKLDVGGNINVQGGNGSYLTFNNGDANIVINNNGSGRDLSFKTYSGSSNAERMRIDKDGNVGIGTISPATKLQVSKAGEVIVRSSMTAADGYRGGFEADNQHTGGTIWSMFSTNNSDGYFGGGKYVIANESMGGVDANTAAKFVIDGGGSVGIGTTSPTATLQVTGDIKIGSGAGSGSDSNNMSIQVSNATYGDTSNLGLLVRNNGTNGQFAQIGFGYSESRCPVVIGSVITSGSGATKGDFIIGTRSTTTGSDAPTERMRITSGGNVGIGTTTPRGKGLEIFRAAGLSSNPQLIISTGESGSQDYSLSTDVTAAGDFCIVKGPSNAAANVIMKIISSGITTFNGFADGDKIKWTKDNVLVGAIGTYNGVPYIGYQGGAGGGIMFNGASIEPTLLGSTRSSNTNDIGSVTYKWRNLYLSGDIVSNGNANFGGNVVVNNMLTINIDDISTGENRGLKLYNENSSGQQWNITAGRVGQENTSFVVRDASNNVDAIIINEQTAGATPLITVANGGDTTLNGEFHIYKNVGDNTISELLRLDCGQNNHNVGKGGAIVFRDINVYTDTAKIIAQRTGNSSASTLQFLLRNSEVMRLRSGGDLCIGGTSIQAVGAITFDKGGNGFTVTNNTTSSAGNGHEYQTFRRNSTQIGSIVMNGTTGVTYSTSSDYRLKEDLKDFAGLDMVCKIPVYDFKWKADENRSYGVMAHELQEILPQAVTSEKDAEKMQEVDYSKIVPLLVKSIQELKAEIELLKNK